MRPADPVSDRTLTLVSSHNSTRNACHDGNMRTQAAEARAPVQCCCMQWPVGQQGLGDELTFLSLLHVGGSGIPAAIRLAY